MITSEAAVDPPNPTDDPIPNQPDRRSSPLNQNRGPARAAGQCADGFPARRVTAGFLRRSNRWKLRPPWVAQTAAGWSPPRRGGRPAASVHAQGSSLRAWRGADGEGAEPNGAGVRAGAGEEDGGVAAGSAPPRQVSRSLGAHDNSSELTALRTGVGVQLRTCTASDLIR